MAMLDARLLLMAATGFDAGELLLNANQEIGVSQADYFYKMITRRKNYEPVAYITGVREFWRGCFRVTHDVLIPRPDSECLIETALMLRPPQMHNNLKIMDLGTGSSCLLTSLLQSYEGSIGVGVDRSLNTCKIAAENLRNNNVSDRGSIIQGDWARALGGAFDIIISNPPYISEDDYLCLAKDILEHEPRAALVSADYGRSDYQIILDQVRHKISDKGLILIEIGDGQSAFLRDIAEQFYATQRITVHQDLAGLDRCLAINHE